MEASNFRPVSLTSTVSKCMESIIRDQMLGYLLENRLIRSSQHGFLPGHSTITQLLSFLELVTGAANDSDWVDCVLLDFRKAFDQVSHDALIYKLHSYGFHG